MAFARSKSLCDSIEFVEVEALSAPRLRERLQCHVQADGVPETKAVCDRASDTVDFHSLALDAMDLDAKIEQRRGDVNDP